MTVGGIELSPELFEGDWPPPVSCPITLKYTATTEAAAETILTGNAHLKSITRNSIKYDLSGPTYDEQIADTTAYNATLNVVIDTILTSIAEITTVNTTYARAISPNVTHTVDGDQLAIELASNIAEFYSHLIYIVGSTAYLVDMLLDNGTQTITEFDFFPAEYSYEEPVAIARCGDYIRVSSYTYGVELSVDPYHTTEANINTALDDIIAIENKVRVRLPIPFLGSVPAPGKKISWTDTALAVDTAAYIRARALTYDFIKEIVTIEGEGEISAA